MRKFFHGLLIAILVLSLTGCEAFVRKFTRKPKNDKFATEEVVLVPQEYSGLDLTKEEKYRRYLFWWASWQDELIAALQPQGGNRKKQLACINEAINNLSQLALLLKEDARRKLDGYIKELSNLQEAISKDSYGNFVASHKINAERLKKDILRDFSYKKVKESLL